MSAHTALSLARRCLCGLIAGTIAIALNSGALAIADAVGVGTAHGGLLRLVRMIVGGLLPLPESTAFTAEFHAVVGVLMALFYAVVLAPAFAGRHLVGGAAYGAVVWLLNASIILPATGEGFAGARHLSALGMVWFLAAHMLFFVAQALLFGVLARISPSPSPPR